MHGPCQHWQTAEHELTHLPTHSQSYMTNLLTEEPVPTSSDVLLLRYGD